jgi:hypothetical protein
LIFWRIYEMGFPEASNVKAPRGFRPSLWSLLICRNYPILPLAEGGIMNFKMLAVITSIIMFVLGAGYLFAGTVFVGRWQIQPTESVLLLARRIGAVYLSLSVGFFLARNAPVSVARTALSTAIAIGCLLLASLGVYEFSAGRAGAGILVSAVVESLLGIGYIWILVTQRKVAAAV